MDDNNCKNKKHFDETTPACVPFFLHENTMMHYNVANKRMLVALITVCITFILTIVIFVFGYTIREKNWLNTLKDLNATPQTEVTVDGVHQLAD